MNGKGRRLLEAVAGPLTTESRGRGLKMAKSSVGPAVVRTHGMSQHPTFRSWWGMCKRSSPDYNVGNYAGVGRDPRWDKFENFYADMGATYFPGAVLGRYGDVGDYTPANCRWITKSESTREMAERRMLRMSDGRLALDVARANGISRLTFRCRVSQYGWDVDRAATEPLHNRGKR
jgi:hypothetical protein